MTLLIFRHMVHTLQCVYLYVSIKTEIFLKPFDQILKSRIHFYCLHAPFLKYSGLRFPWFCFPRFQLPLVSHSLAISTSFTSLLSSHRYCIISRHHKKKGTYSMIKYLGILLFYISNVMEQFYSNSLPMCLCNQ